MNQWGNAVANDLLQLLLHRFGNNFSDITAVKQYWHNLNYLLFSKLNYHLLYGDRPFSLTPFEQHGLIPHELSLFEQEHHDALREFLSLVPPSLFGSSKEVASFREQMLCMELSIQKGSVTLHTGKSERDNTGSYYTPEDLAREVVLAVLATPAGVELMNHPDSLRIADLSCGGGDFFRSTQEVLWERYQIPPSVSCTYFWGIDIDPIALQISICGLLVHAPESRWAEIIGHFHLGNPLLQTDQERSNAEKGALFAIGRLYAPEMGICSSWGPQDGFDLVLGNPPWEKIRMEERVFFSNLCPEIAGLSKKSDRAEKIEALQDSWPQLYSWFREMSDDYAHMSSAKFRHTKIQYAVTGELNTYALFTELSHSVTGRQGITSLIIKSTLATAPAHKKLWGFLMNSGAIDSLALFENTQRIFPIDSRERFAVLTLNHRKNLSFSLAAGLRWPEELRSAKSIPLTAENVTSLNPFSQTLPNITDTESISILRNVHQRLPVFGKVYPHCHFGRLIHLTAHASQIDQQPSPQNVPVYEGKFIERYDARFATFAGMPAEKKYAGKPSARKNEGFPGTKPLPESRYFVHNKLWRQYSAQYPQPFSLCWRSLTSPTNARTTLAMILPTCPTCQSIQLLQTEDNVELLMLLGLFNSLPFDYFVRQKMPGLDLTQSVIRQIPVPRATDYEWQLQFCDRTASLKTHILSCVCARLASEPLLQPLLDSVQTHIYHLPGIENIELEHMLDQLFTQAYGINDTQFCKMKKAFPKY